MKKLIWMSCLTYLINGFGHVIVGSVMDPMVRYYGVDYTAGGQLIMNQFLGFLAGVLLAPWLVSVIGRRSSQFLSLGCFTLAELVYSCLPSWHWMLFAGPIAGFGFGMAETIIAAFIIGSIKEKKASTMVLVEVFFGVGALIMPGLAALLIGLGAWRLVFPILAVITGVTLLLWTRLSFGESNGVKVGDEASKMETGTGWMGYSRPMYPVLIAGVLFFFIYVGVEMSFANFLPTILTKTVNLQESAATAGISVFWAAMSVGRLLIGLVADKLGYRRYMLICSGGTVVGFAAFAFSSHPVVSYGIIIILGLVMAGIFSIGLLLVNHTIPGAAERTTSLLVAFGGLGGAVIPKLTGWMMDRYQAVNTVWMLTVWAVFMLLAMAGIVLLGKRAQRGRSNKHAPIV